jgi:hypothetical protein
MPQTFLEAGQHRLLLSRLDIDDTVRLESCLCDGRCEEIGTCQTPQNLAVRSCGDAGHKHACSGAIHRSGAATGDLMQRAQCQPSSGKSGIDLSQTERQDCPDRSTAGLDRCDASSQRCDVRLGHHAHLQTTTMFLFRSGSDVESKSRVTKILDLWKAT